MTQVQQGDVVARKIEALPEGAKRVRTRAGSYVLAEGEATGHAHRIARVAGLAVYELGGLLYVETETEVAQTHEEHAPVTYAPGVWEVGRVREKDWLADAVRTVAD